MSALTTSAKAVSKTRGTALWRNHATHRDPMAKEELVRLYMPLAKRMASRYSGVSEPYDDLLQVASLGLMNAVDRFDPSQGTPFVAFAKPTILGELKRYFRDKVWAVRVPRPVHDLLARVESANEKLSLDLGRPPTVVELANELAVEPSEVLEVLEAAHNRRPLSLDVSPLPDGEESEAGDWLGEEEQGYELIEDRMMLESVLPVLDAREREILKLRFADELPQTQIASRLGCSQMQVSRLLRQILDRMRERAKAVAG